MPHEQNPSEHEQDREAEDADFITNRMWEIYRELKAMDEKRILLEYCRDEAEKELRETQSFEKKRFGK